MPFVVFLAFVLIALAGVWASSFVEPKPWSVWGRRPRSAEEADRRYHRDEIPPNVTRLVLAGLAGGFGWLLFAVLARFGVAINGDDLRTDVITGIAIIVALWGAAFLTRWGEHRYRLRPFPDEERATFDPGMGSG